MKEQKQKGNYRLAMNYLYTCNTEIAIDSFLDKIRERSWTLEEFDNLYHYAFKKKDTLLLYKEYQELVAKDLEAIKKRPSAFRNKEKRLFAKGFIDVMKNNKQLTNNKGEKDED